MLCWLWPHDAAAAAVVVQMGEGWLQTIPREDRGGCGELQPNLPHRSSVLLCWAYISPLYDYRFGERPRGTSSVAWIARIVHRELALLVGDTYLRESGAVSRYHSSFSMRPISPVEPHTSPGSEVSLGSPGTCDIPHPIPIPGAGGSWSKCLCSDTTFPPVLCREWYVPAL